MALVSPHQRVLLLLRTPARILQCCFRLQHQHNILQPLKTQARAPPRDIRPPPRHPQLPGCRPPWPPSWPKVRACRPASFASPRGRLRGSSSAHADRRALIARRRGRVRADAELAAAKPDAEDIVDDDDLVRPRALLRVRAAVAPGCVFPRCPRRSTPLISCRRRRLTAGGGVLRAPGVAPALRLCSLSHRALAAPAGRAASRTWRRAGPRARWPGSDLYCAFLRVGVDGWMGGRG